MCNKQNVCFSCGILEMLSIAYSCNVDTNFFIGIVFVIYYLLPS